MGKKQAGENSKKAAGNARKAETAARKQAVDDDRNSKAEAADWADGAKSNAKKEAAEAKKAEAARKKAEKDAILAEEEKNARSAPKNKKTAEKKSRGLDLADLDAPSASINASGIDNALDALTLTADGKSDKVERHPERRFKAAFAAYEERRMPELEQEMKGLRQNQRREILRKEFEKHEDNPFNQARVQYNATKDDLVVAKQAEREKIEKRLGA